ncbi:MAG TPA: YciI family protein [Acidimicrobiales bacterium]|nr:YciI family protein [Acidimicrobiales bacterium]
MSTPSDAMTQYVVLIFQRELPGGVADIPPEIMQANEELDGKIAEQGGRVVAGLALEPSTTATVIRGDVITDGPFIETKEALAGLYVLAARDLDHAISLARMTPTVEGCVEVRPLLDFVVLEAG